MAEQTIWPATNGPTTSATDGQPINLSTEFYVTTDARAVGLRFYRGTTDITGPVTGHLVQSSGPGAGTTVPGTEVTFTLDSVGWLRADFTAPVTLTPNQRYKAVVHFPDQFPITAGYWNAGGPGAAGITNTYLVAPNNTDAIDGQGSFSTGAITNYPATSGNGGGYWVDVVVNDETLGGSMANYNAPAGAQAAHVTLTAATEMVVTFEDDLNTVTIVNRGNAEVFYTTDNTAAAVDATNSRVLPAGQSVTVNPSGNAGTVVRLISTGTPKVTVQRA